MKEILLLPVLLALGIGLSLNNARAVLEALFNHHSEFKRTPKYGIEKKRKSWRTSRYSPLRTVLPFIELLFALYFTFFVISAVLNGQYLSLPFLLLFQFGFTYVALSSIAQWIPRIGFFDRNTADPVAA